MKANKVLSGMASLIIALSIAACSSDDANFEQQGIRKKVISLTSALTQTRADSDLQTTALNTNNKVGVFVTNNATTIENGDNNEHSVGTDGSLTTTNTMYYPTEDGAKVNIYAYAPFQEAWSYTSPTKTFTVASDQSTGAGYLASDLIYASATSSNQETINLEFTHKMARLIITLNTNTDLSKATVKVVNTKPSATFNITTGTLGDATGDQTPITVGSDIKLNANNTKQLYAAIIPQSIEANTTLLEVTNGEATWKFKFPKGILLESGHSYTLTVTAGLSTVTSSTTGTATTPGL